MKINKHIPVVLSVISMMAVWQLIAMWVNFPAVFPDVLTLIVQSFKLFSKSEFYFSLASTISRGAIGFFISFCIALISGSLAAFYPFWNRYFNPFVVVIRSVPVISIVLIALLWFSPSQLPVFIALLTMFPVLHQAVLGAFQQVDYRLVEMANVFGSSTMHTFNQIYLPSAKKQIVGGIITATGFGWRAIIIGEVLAQPLHGIGTGMKLSQVYLNMSELFAWTLVAVVFSYLFDIAIKKIAEKRFITLLPNVLNANNNFTDKTQTKTITLNSISKKLSGKSIFNQYNQQFSSDNIYLLKAPSGTGKTTLLRLLSKLLLPDIGTIKFTNIQTIAYSFQDVRLLPWLNVRDNILFAVVHKKDTTKKKLLSKLASEFEIADILDKYPANLSGGQNQRVGLVRALICTPDLLILDEPLNGLHEELKIRVTKVIEQYINGYNPLVIWATHENIKMPSVQIIEIYLSEHADKQGDV